MAKTQGSASYFVPTTSKTLDILEAFQSPGEDLTLEELVRRSSVARTTAFRILYTLEQRRYVTRLGKHYRLNPRRKKIRIGFGSLTTRLPFAREVAASLTSAAAAAGIELVIFDNHRDPQTALKNARKMVAERVDVAIEFQRHADVSPAIADIFTSANVPLVAVHIPHPGAFYFGVNNYKSGLCAGKALAKFARRRFGGEFDLLVLLDVPEGGIVLQSRMSGALQSVQELLGPQPAERIVRAGGGAEREIAKTAITSILASHPKARRILVSASSDEGALGALEVLKKAGFAATSAIVGMEGSDEALTEIARPNSPYIGTVAYFPDQYGPALIDLVLRIVNGEQVPPFRYIDHEFIDQTKATKLLAGSL